MPLDARWYCFFSLSREPPLKQTGTSPPLWSASRIGLSPRSQAAAPIFGPTHPVRLTGTWRFPQNACDSNRKKKPHQRTSPWLWYAAWGSTAQEVLIWCRRSEWNLFRVSQRGGCHGSAELSFCMGPGSWSWKRPKLGFVTECTANVGVVEASWALD